MSFRLQGHANVIVTLDTYSYELPHIQSHAAEKMDAMLSKTGCSKSSQVINTEGSNLSIFLHFAGILGVAGPGLEPGTP